jgi:hypothetical protein
MYNMTARTKGPSVIERASHALNPSDDSIKVEKWYERKGALVRKSLRSAIQKSLRSTMKKSPSSTMNKHSSNYLVDNRVCMKTTHIGEGDYGVLIGKKCYSNSCKRERKRQTKLMNLCMKKQNTINDPESDDYIKLDEEISNNYAEEIEKCTNDNCEKRAAADFGPLMMTGGDKRKTHRRRRGKSRSYKKRM